jgi:hypothetical protein
MGRLRSDKGLMQLSGIALFKWSKLTFSCKEKSNWSERTKVKVKKHVNDIRLDQGVPRRS